MLTCITHLLSLSLSVYIYIFIDRFTYITKMSSVRKRGVASTSTSTSTSTTIITAPSLSLSQRAVSQTLTSTANLANLLPTGTLLAFQLLTPLFTNNGSCDSVTHFLTIILFSLLSLSCFLASFTDTVTSSDGKVYHGIATFNGLWLFDYYPDIDDLTPSHQLPDLRKYKVRFIDWVHAVLSVLVFCVVALRDKNVVSCFYPNPEHETQQVLDIVPLGVGTLCSLLFLLFPTSRHGIGFPVTPPK